MQQTTPNLTLNHRASLWMLLDRTLASFSLVQLALRELMEGCPHHSLELGSSGTEHGGCRTTRPSSRIPVSVATFGLVCPEP